MMPSMARLNGLLISLRNQAAQAQSTYDLAETLDDLDASAAGEKALIEDTYTTAHDDLVPAVAVDRVTVSYPGSRHPALVKVSLNLAPGTSVAIVGATGAGKSTLTDVLLGILPPDRGTVEIGGLSPAAAIQR